MYTNTSKFVNFHKIKETLLKDNSQPFAIQLQKYIHQEKILLKLNSSSNLIENNNNPLSKTCIIPLEEGEFRFQIGNNQYGEKMKECSLFQCSACVYACSEKSLPSTSESDFKDSSSSTTINYCVPFHKHDDDDDDDDDYDDSEIHFTKNNHSNPTSWNVYTGGPVYLTTTHFNLADELKDVNQIKNTNKKEVKNKSVQVSPEQSWTDVIKRLTVKRRRLFETESLNSESDDLIINENDEIIMAHYNTLHFDWDGSNLEHCHQHHRSLSNNAVGKEEEVTELRLHPKRVFNDGSFPNGFTAYTSDWNDSKRHTIKEITNELKEGLHWITSNRSKFSPLKSEIFESFGDNETPVSDDESPVIYMDKYVPLPSVKSKYAVRTPPVIRVRVLSSNTPVSLKQIHLKQNISNNDIVDDDNNNTTTIYSNLKLNREVSCTTLKHQHQVNKIDYSSPSRRATLITTQTDKQILPSCDIKFPQSYTTDFPSLSYNMPRFNDFTMKLNQLYECGANESKKMVPISKSKKMRENLVMYTTSTEFAKPETSALNYKQESCTRNFPTTPNKILHRNDSARKVNRVNEFEENEMKKMVSMSVGQKLRENCVVYVSSPEFVTPENSVVTFHNEESYTLRKKMSRSNDLSVKLNQMVECAEKESKKMVPEWQDEKRRENSVMYTNSPAYVRPETSAGYHKQESYTIDLSSLQKRRFHSNGLTMKLAQIYECGVNETKMVPESQDEKMRENCVIYTNLPEKSSHCYEEESGSREFVSLPGIMSPSNDFTTKVNHLNENGKNELKKLRAFPPSEKMRENVVMYTTLPEYTNPEARAHFYKQGSTTRDFQTLPQEISQLNGINKVNRISKLFDNQIQKTCSQGQKIIGNCLVNTALPEHAKPETNVLYFKQEYSARDFPQLPHQMSSSNGFATTVTQVNECVDNNPKKILPMLTSENVRESSKMLYNVSKHSKPETNTQYCFPSFPPKMSHRSDFLTNVNQMNECKENRIGKMVPWSQGQQIGENCVMHCTTPDYVSPEVSIQYYRQEPFTRDFPSLPSKMSHRSGFLTNVNQMNTQNRQEKIVPWSQGQQIGENCVMPNTSPENVSQETGIQYYKQEPFKRDFPSLPTNIWHRTDFPTNVKQMNEYGKNEFERIIDMPMTPSQKITQDRVMYTKSPEISTPEHFTPQANAQYYNQESTNRDFPPLPKSITHRNDYPANVNQMNEYRENELGKIVPVSQREKIPQNRVMYTTSPEHLTPETNEKMRENVVMYTTLPEYVNSVKSAQNYNQATDLPQKIWRRNDFPKHVDLLFNQINRCAENRLETLIPMSRSQKTRQNCGLYNTLLQRSIPETKDQYYKQKSYTRDFLPLPKKMSHCTDCPANLNQKNECEENELSQKIMQNRVMYGQESSARDFPLLHRKECPAFNHLNQQNEYGKKEFKGKVPASQSQKITQNRMIFNIQNRVISPEYSTEYLTPETSSEHYKQESCTKDFPSLPQKLWQSSDFPTTLNQINQCVKNWTEKTVPSQKFIEDSVTNDSSPEHLTPDTRAKRNNFSTNQINQYEQNRFEKMVTMSQSQKIIEDSVTNDSSPEHLTSDARAKRNNFSTNQINQYEQNRFEKMVPMSQNQKIIEDSVTNDSSPEHLTTDTRAKRNNVSTNQIHQYEQNRFEKMVPVSQNQKVIEDSVTNDSSPEHLTSDTRAERNNFSANQINQYEQNTFEKMVPMSQSQKFSEDSVTNDSSPELLTCDPSAERNNFPSNQINQYEQNRFDKMVPMSQSKIISEDSVTNDSSPDSNAEPYIQESCTLDFPSLSHGSRGNNLHINVNQMNECEKNKLKKMVPWSQSQKVSQTRVMYTPSLETLAPEMNSHYDKQTYYTRDFPPLPKTMLPRNDFYRKKYQIYECGVNEFGKNVPVSQRQNITEDREEYSSSPEHLTPETSTQCYKQEYCPEDFQSLPKKMFYRNDFPANVSQMNQSEKNRPVSLGQQLRENCVVYSTSPDSSAQNFNQNFRYFQTVPNTGDFPSNHVMSHPNDFQTKVNRINDIGSRNLGKMSQRQKIRENVVYTSSLTPEASVNLYFYPESFVNGINGFCDNESKEPITMSGNRKILRSPKMYTTSQPESRTSNLKPRSNKILLRTGEPAILFNKYGFPLTDLKGRMLKNIFGNELLFVRNTQELGSSMIPVRDCFSVRVYHQKFKLHNGFCSKRIQIKGEDNVPIRLYNSFGYPLNDEDGVLLYDANRKLMVSLDDSGVPLCCENNDYIFLGDGTLWSVVKDYCKVFHFVKKNSEEEYPSQNCLDIYKKSLGQRLEPELQYSQKHINDQEIKTKNDSPANRLASKEDGKELIKLSDIISEIELSLDTNDYYKVMLIEHIQSRN